MAKKIRPGYIVPSSSFIITKKQVKNYEFIERKPEVGDVVYGKIISMGQHSQLENKNGRIHKICDGTKSLFVFGNRYATDYYEGIIPDHTPQEIDLLARSGVIGTVLNKNDKVKDPTRVKIWGYVLDENGEILNTKKCVKNSDTNYKNNKSKLILVIGSSMNSGKSTTAASICWALSSMDKYVTSSKITGTASLKDILTMQDYGSSSISDFTYLGYPSTYMASEEDLLYIMKSLDHKYGNVEDGYWIIEIADGILQRETKILLQNKEFRKRIHKIVFASTDSLGIIGGLQVLKNNYDLEVNAISGICSSSKLFTKELENINIPPIINNLSPDKKQIMELLS